MPIRNSHRIGDHLMRDDESGFVHYRSEMRRIWDGSWRRIDQFETRQPQEFVRAKSDPKALRHIRPEENATKPRNTVCGYIGGDNTTVQTSQSPAGHLFQSGIGCMVIEGSNSNTVFKVR